LWDEKISPYIRKVFKFYLIVRRLSIFDWRIKMVLIDLILSLPFIFLLAALVSVSLYIIGSKISPKFEKTPNKISSYACGENLEAERFRIGIQRFFLYVTYFMIFDISAFMLALSFNVKGFYPILFSIIIALSLLTIIPTIERK